MTGYIYCITNTVNSKMYVGKTLSALTKRFQEHCRDSRKPHREHRPLYRAMKKYGEDKFSIILLEKVDVELLEEREAYWIQKLDTYKNGYNATRGGDGKILYGKNFEQDVITDYETGMTVSEIAFKYKCDHNTVRKRLRSAGISSGENHFERNRHAVSQYTSDEKFVQSFSSKHEAAYYLIENGLGNNLLGLVTHIGDVIRGKRKTCAGYIWKEA